MRLKDLCEEGKGSGCLPNERVGALAETSATGLLWGTSFPVIEFGIASGIDPRVFAFLRFALAAPIMIAFARVYGKPLSAGLRTKPVWILGFLNAVGFLCQFLGQAHTAASVAALLVNLSVLIAAIGSAALLGEKFTGTKVVGTVLAVGGIFLLTTRGDFGLITGSQLTGDLFYLASASSWGVYIIYNKRKTDERRWDPLGVASLTILSTAVFVAPVMLTVGPAELLMTEGEWGLILYTALLNTAIPFVLYQRGLRYLTATVSSMLLMLEIVTAMGISILILGELLDLPSLIGAISILSSIFLVSRVGGSGESLSIRTPSGLARGGTSSWS